MKKKLLVMLIAALLAVPATVFAVAGVLDDEVTSIKLKEADGTSGQNTNAGSGVKTDHIQNNAVNSDKILNGAVNSDKIAIGAVISEKISDGAVTSAKLANGSITDDKIVGPISASKISSVGLDADTVDGLHASEFARASHIHAISDVSGLQTSLDGKADVIHQHPELQKKCANVVVVANSGGNFTDLNQAINSITDASIDNPYLIKIMPGVYDITTTINTKPFVNIDGSGVNMTKLTRYADYGTAFEIVPFSKLSNLTIELSTSNVASGVILDLDATISKVNINKVGQGGFIGIMVNWYNNGNGRNILIEDVKMSAPECDNWGCYGINMGTNYVNVTIRDFEFVASAPEINQVIGIYAAGYNNLTLQNGKIEVPSSNINVGIFASAGTMDFNNLSINAGPGKGVQVSNEGIYIFRNSKITGTSASIQNDYSTVNLVSTQIAGLMQATGQVKCISVFDENFSPLTCQ